MVSFQNEGARHEREEGTGGDSGAGWRASGLAGPFTGNGGLKDGEVGGSVSEKLSSRQGPEQVSAAI